MTLTYLFERLSPRALRYFELGRPAFRKLDEIKSYNRYRSRSDSPGRSGVVLDFYQWIQEFLENKDDPKVGQSVDDYIQSLIKIEKIKQEREEELKKLKEASLKSYQQRVEAKQKALREGYDTNPDGSSVLMDDEKIRQKTPEEIAAETKLLAEAEEEDDFRYSLSWTIENSEVCKNIKPHRYYLKYSDVKYHQDRRARKMNNFGTPNYPISDLFKELFYYLRLMGPAKTRGLGSNTGYLVFMDFEKEKLRSVQSYDNFGIDLLLYGHPFHMRTSLSNLGHIYRDPKKFRFNQKSAHIYRMARLREVFRYDDYNLYDVLARFRDPYKQWRWSINFGETQYFKEGVMLHPVREEIEWPEAPNFLYEIKIPGGKAKYGFWGNPWDRFHKKWYYRAYYKPLKRHFSKGFHFKDLYGRNQDYFGNTKKNSYFVKFGEFLRYKPKLTHKRQIYGEKQYKLMNEFMDSFIDFSKKKEKKKQEKKDFFYFLKKKMKKNVEKRMPTNYMNFDSYDFLQEFNDDLHRFRSMSYLYGENYPNDYDKSIETPFEKGHYYKKFQNFFAPFSNYWFSYFMLNVGLCFSYF